MVIMKTRALKSDATLLLAAVIWGLAFTAQRKGMEYVGPFIFNSVRFALGSLTLVPFIIKGRNDKRRGSDQVPPTGKGSEAEEGYGTAGTSGTGNTSFTRGISRSGEIFGAGMLAGSVLFVAVSLQQVGIVTTTAGKAGFITGLYVVIVPVLGVFLRNRTGLWTWLGALSAVVGLYLLSIHGDFGILRGDLLVLLGAFMWAAHVLVIGRLSPGRDSLRLASVQFAVVAVLSFLVSVFTEEISAGAIMDAAIPIIYGGCFSVGVSFTLQVVAQREAPPSHVAIILSLESVFAVIGGWIILGEVLSGRGIIGCGLMLAGMILSQLGSPYSRRGV
jgi:drug/metabolite transporter (DMT)-like permease